MDTLSFGINKNVIHLTKNFSYFTRFEPQEKKPKLLKNFLNITKISAPQNIPDIK